MGNSEEVKSVLALAPNWLGDTVMCTPALRALRRRYPEATLTVAANPACCDLLEDLPWIDGLFRLLPKSSLLPLMRQAKQLGCHTYDMWGAPEIFDESDSMWGVYRFKEGFNGIVTRTLGAWDYTTRPWLYRRYTETLPKLLNLLRRRGLEANKRSLND